MQTEDPQAGDNPPGAPAAAAAGSIFFDDYELNLRQRVLLRQGEIVRLAPKALDLCELLVSRANQVVSKDDLVGKLWPQTFVSEVSLAKLVFLLRKELGVAPNGQQYIETVPKRGYRFVSRGLSTSPKEQDPPASDVVGQPPAAKSRAGFYVVVVLLILAGSGWVFFHRSHTARSRVPIESVVVLPFAMRDASLEYLSEGLTDGLMNDLSRLGPLRVIARTTAFRYRNTTKPLQAIGRELDVDAIVTGDVRRNEERLIVNAELVETGSGTRLWGEHYERGAHDLRSIEREIAAAVARTAASPGRPAAPEKETSHEAYDLYLKGRYFWNKRTSESVTKALALFNQAVDLDPTYARAYSGIADCYIEIWKFGTSSRRQACDRASAAARRALELDDGLAEAHTSLGFVDLACEIDLAAAEREFQRALQLNPNHAQAHHHYGVYLTNVGRADEGTRQMREAVRLDPFSTQIQANVAFALFHAGHRDEAFRAIQDAIDLDPAAPYPHHMRGYLALATGDKKAAVNEFQAAADRKFSLSLPFLALASAQAGDKESARRILGEIDRSTNDAAKSHALRAVVEDALGNRDLAFRLLDQAYEERDYWLSAMRTSALYDSLRPDPRFGQLMERVYRPRVH